MSRIGVDSIEYFYGLHVLFYVLFARFLQIHYNTLNISTNCSAMFSGIVSRIRIWWRWLNRPFYRKKKKTWPQQLEQSLPWKKAQKKRRSVPYLEQPREQRRLLLEQNERLIAQLRKSNSLLRRFFMGIMMGVGTAVGATLILGVALTVLARLVNSFEDIPIINTIIENYRLDEYVDELLEQNNIQLEENRESVEVQNVDDDQ